MLIDQAAMKKYLSAEVRKELGKGWKVMSAEKMEDAVLFQAVRELDEGGTLVLSGTIKEVKEDE